MQFRPFGPVLVFMALVSSLAGPALSAAPEPWERWRESDERSALRPDHADFSAFLARHVRPGPDGINRFAYGEVASDDRVALEAYLARLTRECVTCLRRADQRAYWINLYNALTLDVVLGHYPVATIRDIDISPGWFSQGPWRKKLVEIEGTPVSLDDIEHRILRPLWNDPRTHYAVNCASLGCPNLMPEAYTAENMETLLDAGARAYVNHPRGVSIEGNELVVSSIYAWFEVDFGGGERGVIRHLIEYAEPELARRLRGFDSIDDDDYDWSLNDAR